MFREDRITYAARLLAQSRVVVPVIIRSRPGRILKIVSEIKDFEEVRNVEPIFLGNEIIDEAFKFKIIERFNMVSAILPREVIFALADNPDVEKIYPDRVNYAFQYPRIWAGGVFTAPYKATTKKITFTTTSWTKELIGANVANAKGYRGNGVKVSVIDTGASRIHEMLRGRVSTESVMEQQRDENGHGTYISACIGGVKGIDEYLSQRAHGEVNCEGIAPECNLLAIKSLGYFVGAGSISDCIKAIALSLVRGADIINMSLGFDTSDILAPQDDPYYTVFQEVIGQNVIPVVAAGNSGARIRTINSPGSLPNVLTIGAYDEIQGMIAPFSSRGPTMWGDVKPDVVAPGVNIDNATVGVLDNAGDGVPSRYSPLSGTSMATPMVSGLLTLMRECMMEKLAKPLTLDEVKAMMQALGVVKNNTEGWGIISWQIFEKWMSTQYGIVV